MEHWNIGFEKDISHIASGTITKADVLMHIKNVLEDPDFVPHFHAVVRFEEKR